MCFNRINTYPNRAWFACENGLERQLLSPSRTPDKKEINALDEQEKSASLSKSGRARMASDCMYRASTSSCKGPRSAPAVHVVKPVQRSRQLFKAHGRMLSNVLSFVVHCWDVKQQSIMISSKRNPKYTALIRDVTVLCRPCGRATMCWLSGQTSPMLLEDGKTTSMDGVRELDRSSLGSDVATMSRLSVST